MFPNFLRWSNVTCPESILSEHFVPNGKRLRVRVCLITHLKHVGQLLLVSLAGEHSYALANYEI